MAELMRQVVVSRRGGPEVLEVRQAPVPIVGKGQVRIRVAAAVAGKIVLQTPLGSSR